MILLTGKLLVALVFLSATAVGVIAVLEGDGAAVVYSTAGRPAMFLPIGYLSILVVGVLVGIALLAKKFFKRKHNLQSKRVV